MRARLSSLASVLMLVLALAPARAAASCDANNTYNFTFSSVADASLNYANSYTYTASNPLGATRNFTISFVANGLASNQVNGENLPQINSSLTTSTGAKTLQIGGVFSARTATINSATRTIRTTFTFAVPVRDIVISTHDLDFTNNQFRDWLYASGSDGTSTFVPQLTAPAGNSNSGARTAAASSVTFGSFGAPFNISSNEGVGNSSSNNTAVTTGDVAITFPQPVTSVTLYYGNFPLQAGETVTGQQFVGISAVRFCPMPNVSIAKTSTPYAVSGPDRFNTPGSDVSYALTVTNGGGSPVDLSSLQLTDVLPANVTFYNGDYDAASPGMGPFQLTAGTSGVTLPAGGRAYSNNGGATYVYTPAAGYDANVKAVRLTPTGSMAANSSFTIRFRARIN
jgi:uncharacterized repeat protein (TIGR01451 family)